MKKYTYIVGSAIAGVLLLTASCASALTGTWSFTSGVPTTTPDRISSIDPEVRANNFVATSTTATSSFAGYILGGASNFVVTPQGKVGIGTTNPTYTLIVSPGTFDQNVLSIGGIGNQRMTVIGSPAFSSGVITLGDVNGNDLGEKLTLTDSSGAINMSSSVGANNFIVTRFGNSGFGTSSPGSLLSLGNTGNDTINLNTLATSTFGSGLNIRTGCYAINGTCLSTSGGGSTGNSKWATTTAGNAIIPNSAIAVGIGSSTPRATLSIGTTTQGSGLVSLLAVASSTNKTLFTVLGNGNVGIGTANPLFPFDVVNQSTGFRLFDVQPDGSVTVERGLLTVNDGFSATDPNSGCRAIVTGNDGNSDVQLGDIDGCRIGSFLDVSPGANTATFNGMGVAIQGGYGTGNSLDVVGGANIGTSSTATTLTVGGTVRADTFQSDSANSILALNGNAVFKATVDLQNVFVGQATGNTTVTGFNNTAIGYGTMNAITTGTNNFGAGVLTFAACTSCTNNVGNGVQTLSGLISGQGNIGIGTFALDSETTNSFNIGVGFAALFSADSYGNTAIGHQAGRLITSGQLDTFIGFNSGEHSGAGSAGASAGDLLQSAAINQSTALGYGSVVNCSNCFVLGSVASGDTVDVGIGTTSPYAHLDLVGAAGQTRPLFQISSLSATFSTTTQLILTSTGSLGIGTSTPSAALSVQSNSSTGNAFVVATSSGNNVGGMDNDGHTFTSGPAPAISSCGTGTGTVVGDDQSGTITTATAATACTMTFSKAYKKTPTCTVTDNSLVGFADISTISTSAVTFGISSALTGGNLYYQCTYHQ